MKVVAVTACGTGIAHTYMSAEGLKKAANEAGDEIRVEIQGAMGIEHRLTQEEIDAADLIIFASDIGIRDRERFLNKKIVEVHPGKVIGNPTKAYKEAKSKVD